MEKEKSEHESGGREEGSLHSTHSATSSDTPKLLLHFAKFSMLDGRGTIL